MALAPLLVVAWEMLGDRTVGVDFVLLCFSGLLAFFARAAYVLSRPFFSGRRRMVGWPAGYDPREYSQPGRTYVWLFLLLGGTGLGVFARLVLSLMVE